MIDSLLKASIVRRFIKLGVPTTQALQIAQKMDEGRSVFIVRNSTNFKPTIILTIGRNPTK
tara:strand:+ start:945 stop:1127 length:183 start_codon:yes stop_codon:yes gene_type:complete